MAYLDTDQAFGEIAQTDNAFRTQLFEIVQCQQSREIARRWADRLRFLTSPMPPEEPLLDDMDSDTSSRVTVDSGRGSMYDDASSADFCSCATMPLSTRHDQTTTLVLTEPDAFPNCIHYVAVSYCWESAETVSAHGLYSTIQTPTGPRAPHAPPGILHRAMRFAAHWDETFVWIDQECIEQDNPDDKEYGIQAMDLVYQRSVRPVGLLTCVIRTQPQMDRLTALVEGLDIAPDHLAVLADVLDLLAHDPWFTRAWILQESVVGGLAMTLLIRHDPALAKPATLGDMSDEIELDLSALLAAVDWARACVDAAESALAPSLLRRLRAAIQSIYDAQPGHVAPAGAAIAGDPDYRQTCNAAQALAFLEPRKNTRIADRLAIVANLCDFAVRINTLTAEENGYSFSMCAFVLSLLNGDLSLVDSYRRQEMTARLAFSWGPPRSWRLNGLTWDDDRYVYRLVSPELSTRGLGLTGWVWRMDRWLDMRDVQARYQALVQRVDPETDMAVSRVLVLQVIHALIRRLRDVGLVSLAGLVEAADRAIGRVYEHDDGRDFDEKVQFLRQGVLDRSQGNPGVAETYHAQWKWDYDQSPRRTVLFDAICNHGGVLLGRLVHDPSDVCPAPDGDHYQAVFDPSVQMENLVLVPCLQRDTHIPRSTDQDRPFTPVCWRVTFSSDGGDGDGAARAVEGHQVVQGMWIADDEANPGRYLLA